MALKRAGVQLVVENQASFLAGLHAANNAVLQFGSTAGGGVVSGGLSTLTGALGNIAQVVTGILTSAVFLRAADGLLRMGGEALAAAANFQVLQIQMQGLIGIQIADQMEQVSGHTANMAVAMMQAEGPAKALLGWITDFAIRTPFTVQSLTEMTRGFLAIGIGVEPTKRLTSGLASLAGGLGLTQAQLDRVVQNIQQTSRSMKITERDIREFGNAGIPVNRVLDAMAQQLGTTRLAALEFAKSGEAGVKAFVEGIQSVAEKDFPNALDNMSKTWAVAASNIRDVIESVFGKEVLGPIVAVFSGMISDTINKVLEMRPAFTELGLKIEGTFKLARLAAEPFLESLGNLFNAVLKLFGIDTSGFTLDKIFLAIDTAIVKAFGALTRFTDWLTTVVSSPEAAAFIGWLGSVKHKLETLASSIWEKVGPALDDVKKFLGDIAAITVPAIMDNLTKSLEALQKIWDAHGTEFTAILDWLLKLSGVVLINTADTITSIGTALLQLLAGDWAGAGKTFNDWYERFVDNSARLAGTDATSMSESWVFALNTMSLALTLVLNQMSEELTTKLNEMSTGLTTWLNTTAAQWQTNWDLFVIIVTTKWTEISTAITTKLTEISTTITTKWTEIYTTVTTKLTEISTTVKTKLAEMLAEFTTKLTEITTLISAKVNEWLSTLRSFMSQFFDIGVDFVQGIANGIISRAQAVIDAIVAAVTAAIAAARAAIAAFSPSRVTAELIGEPMAQGIAQGILDAAKEIQQALNASISAAIVAPMGQTVAPVASAAQQRGRSIANSVQNSYAFNVQANYAQTQSPAQLSDDLAAMLAMASL